MIISAFTEDGGAGLVFCSLGTGGHPAGCAVLAARVRARVVFVRFTGGMAAMKQRINVETNLEMVDCWMMAIESSEGSGDWHSWTPCL